jgi:hypothetical protein
MQWNWHQSWICSPKQESQESQWESQLCSSLLRSQCCCGTKSKSGSRNWWKIGRNSCGKYWRINFALLSFI